MSDRRHPEQQPPSELGKRAATIRAELARRGFVLVPHAGGGYVVARWGQLTDLADDEAAAKFLQRVGGPAA